MLKVQTLSQEQEFLLVLLNGLEGGKGTVF